jgi:hypothetical protein
VVITLIPVTYSKHDNTSPRRVRWIGHVTHPEEVRNVYKIFVRKSEGMGVDESVDLIHLVWDRV